MATEVAAVPPSTPATSLARLLADLGISAAPVADAGGRRLGIVTEADPLRRLAGAEDGPAGWPHRLFRGPGRQAERYARTHGVEARDVMEEHRVKRLPAVGEDGRLVGVVSRADLPRAVPEPSAKLGAEPPQRDARIRAALRKEVRGQPWAGSPCTFAGNENGAVTLHGFVRSATRRSASRPARGRRGRGSDAPARGAAGAGAPARHG